MLQQQQHCTLTPTEWNHSFFFVPTNKERRMKLRNLLWFSVTFFWEAKKWNFLLNDSRRVFGWKDNLRNCVYKIPCGVLTLSAPEVHFHCADTLKAEHSQQARLASQLDDRQPDFTIWLELGWTVEQHCRNVKNNIATKCQEKKTKKNRTTSPRPMDNSGGWSCA